MKFFSNLFWSQLMRPLSLQDNPMIIRPGVIPVTPVSSYQLPRTFNAEDAKSNAELAEKRRLKTSA
jgi:hypothetical protein